MKHIIFLINLSLLFSLTFHDDLIPLSFDGEELGSPFVGGFNRPKIQWLDWDMDGDVDLFLLDASGYLRYFVNEGSASSPDFHLITPMFQEIACGGWFYFADYDGDGDMDLTAQNIENPNIISYFRNNGGELAFLSVLITNLDYVYSYSVMTPTFADIDGDGDLDFFTGNMTGTLNYYENVSGLSELPLFEFITSSWQDIYIVGGVRTEDRHGASAITFIDLDGDGDLDLSWGDYYQQSLYIIWNSGDAQNPYMVEVTNQYPPETPMESAGQNMPTFADLDGDGDNDLFVTVLSGAFGNQLVNNFHHYENIGSSSSPTYEYRTNNYFSMLDVFSNGSPEFVDIDFDGDLDLFIANQYDLSSTPWVGHIYLFKNNGTDNGPIYEETSSSLSGKNMGQMLSPEFGDLDGDGDPDLLLGDFNGFIQYFENVSMNDELNFTLIGNVGEIDLSGNSVPTLGDLDGDGDLDMLIGQLNGDVAFYRNGGTNLQHAFIEEGLLDIQVQSNSAPELFDVDDDGDLDLFLGSGTEGILFHENIGDAFSFDFMYKLLLSVPLLGPNVKPAVGRLFNEEALDIIAGVLAGGAYHVQILNCENLGDMNGDGGWNVLDIVALANCILAANCNDVYNGCVGDMNGDGGHNVLDIVALANCVLASTCSG